MNYKCITWLLMVLLIPAVYGISMEISSPKVIMQGESESASFTISTNNVFNGIVYLGYSNLQSQVNSVVILNTSFSGSGPYTYQFEWGIMGVDAGTYSVSGNLVDNSGVTLATSQIQNTVDSSAPIITDESPSGYVTGSSTSLKVTTNEDATCKYGSANASYNSLSNIFGITGSKNHEELLTNLGHGSRTYYVRCKDLEGYEMSRSEMIEFKVDLPPTAEIILSEEAPLKAGVIGVTVVTSEDLEEAPTLTYSFDNSPGSKRPISLTGSDSTWEGQMIITGDYDNLVGTFHFTGKDKLGIEGTTIREGKSFVVDTTKPPTPISLEAVSKKKGAIELKWYYDGEDVEYFRVYRSTTSGVDYVDYYVQTENVTRYIDYSTEDKATYYYKINAIDKAGNAGYLSEEIYATAISEGSNKKTETKVESEEEEETPKVLPPNLVIKVNDQIKKAEKLLIDVDAVLSDLDSKEDKEAISQLGVIGELGSIKTKLENIKHQLNNLKQEYRTAADLDSELGKIDLELNKVLQTTPRDIGVIEKSDSIQSLSQKDIDTAIEKLFSQPGFDNIEQNTYRIQNRAIQANIDVLITAYVIEIEFLDGETKEQTLIIKSIKHKSPENLKDVILYEIIPKEIAQDVSEIHFITKDYEVVEADPIVKFGYSNLGSEGTEIKYTLDKKISFNSVRKSASVILIGPIQLEQDYNEITGYSIASILGSDFGFGKREILFAIVGILIIGALVGYQILSSQGYEVSKPRFIDNIKKRGSKIRDSILTKSDEQVSVRLKTNKELEVINELINWGNRHVDEAEISKAKMLYPRIELLYRSLSKEDKLKVFKKCADLQDKINKI